jgi:Holliday junction resolvase RusA-like endonuclease
MTASKGGWRFIIKGQPLSWNHAYKRVTYKMRQPDGTMRVMNRMGKADGVEAYQEGIILLAKVARPSGWTHPKDTPIRIRYWFYTNPLIDTDNMKKLVNDAIAKAIGVNDKWFLTCDVVNFKVQDGHQRIEVEIDSDPGHQPQ